MNKLVLSNWVKEQTQKQTCSALGRRIGVASQTIGEWRDMKINSLRHESVLALSVYRKEETVATYEWLEMEPASSPAVDLHEKVAALELAVKQLQGKAAAA
ncbi:MAG: hypothetical protein ACFB14_08795 [Leptolyngbyaceae cyanobacterium]